MREYCIRLMLVQTENQQPKQNRQFQSSPQTTQTLHKLYSTQFIARTIELTVVKVMPKSNKLNPDSVQFSDVHFHIIQSPKVENAEK